MYQIPDSVCFIDLETLPADATVGMDLTRAPGWEPGELVVVPPERRHVPSNYKKASSIIEWEQKEQIRLQQARGGAEAKALEVQDEERAKALKHWRDGSTDGYRARIACISIAFGERPVQVIDCVEDEEGGLRELGTWLHRGVEWIGPPRFRYVAHHGDVPRSLRED